MDTNDETLMERVRAGDTRALGTLYGRHAGSALAVAYRVLGEHGVAEDVVHDTFVALWQNAHRFERTRGTARAWILTIARNRAIDRRRAVRPTIAATDADAFAFLSTSADPTLDEVLGRLDRGELRDAIESLPNQQREAIDLAYFGGHTYREIAAITGVPQGTANGRLSRGLSNLRERLSRRARDAIAVESGVAQGRAE
ncbi:MAG: RNA polymerase sigma factor [Chloroflexota bacterium]|nr:RNA polymerase sigma factor [Chloroflexota bacterium]